MLQRNTASITKGLRKTFLKNYRDLFTYTLQNYYMCINYVNKAFIKITVNKQNLICTSLKKYSFNIIFYSK